MESIIFEHQFEIDSKKDYFDFMPVMSMVAKLELPTGTGPFDTKFVSWKTHRSYHFLWTINYGTKVIIEKSPFIDPELLEIEKKTCRIASCEMVFESVAARLLHEQEFKDSILLYKFWC